MRVLDILQRVALVVFVAIPLLIITLDAIFQWAETQEDNPIVEFVGDTADGLVPEALQTVFADQEMWQTVLLAFIAYAVVAALIVLLFELLRRLVMAVQSRMRKRDQA
jgi:ABC-type Fe3+ transport system permease subunit